MEKTAYICTLEEWQRETIAASLPNLEESDYERAMSGRVCDLEDAVEDFHALLSALSAPIYCDEWDGLTFYLVPRSGDMCEIFERHYIIGRGATYESAGTVYAGNLEGLEILTDPKAIAAIRR